jgi:hypothetical protein
MWDFKFLRSLKVKQPLVPICIKSFSMQDIYFLLFFFVSMVLSSRSDMYPSDHPKNVFGVQVHRGLLLNFFFLKKVCTYRKWYILQVCALYVLWTTQKTNSDKVWSCTTDYSDVKSTWDTWWCCRTRIGLKTSDARQFLKNVLAPTNQW